ncbi:MAG: hypothetical protein QM776_08495 [Rhodocyclaceae bacterium]
MHALLRQSALLLCSVVLLYALLLGLSLWWLPPATTRVLDTGSAARSLYLTEPKYVFLQRAVLDNERDKVLLLGASNVVAGFRQAQIQPQLRGLEVHNLGVGGSNVTQLAQLVELVHAAQTPAARQHNTFVIGLWYGLFASNAVRWHTPDRHAGDTDIDIERYRYGFFRRTEQGPVALWPQTWLQAGNILIHPFLVLDKLARDATVSLRRQVAGKTPELSNAQRDAAVVSAAERQRYLHFWRDYMGGNSTLQAEQFRELGALITDIVEQGGRVVLVDLPIPAWHATQSPYDADYRQRLAQDVVHYQINPHVTYVQLPTGNADTDFSDEVHPKPRVAQRWASSLAAVLNGEDASPLVARALAVATQD